MQHRWGEGSGDTANRGRCPEPNAPASPNRCAVGWDLRASASDPRGASSVMMYAWPSPSSDMPNTRTILRWCSIMCLSHALMPVPVAAPVSSLIATASFVTSDPAYTGPHLPIGIFLLNRTLLYAISKFGGSGTPIGGSSRGCSVDIIVGRLDLICSSLFQLLYAAFPSISRAALKKRTLTAFLYCTRRWRWAFTSSLIKETAIILLHSFCSLNRGTGYYSGGTITEKGETINCYRNNSAEAVQFSMGVLNGKLRAVYKENSDCNGREKAANIISQAPVY